MLDFWGCSLVGFNPRGQVGKWKLALHAFDEFSKYQLLPDLISYNALMSACEKAGKWQMAMHVFFDIYEILG